MREFIRGLMKYAFVAAVIIVLLLLAAAVLLLLWPDLLLGVLRFVLAVLCLVAGISIIIMLLRMVCHKE